MEKCKIRILLENKTLTIILFLIWGIMCAWWFTAPYFDTVGNGWIARWRADYLTSKYLCLLQNGHPLDGGRGISAYSFYYPYIMKILNISDGYDTLVFMQALLGAVVVSVYPLMCYFLFGSVFVGIVSPIVAHLTFADYLYINKAGEYFGQMWIVALGFPLLLLLIKAKDKRHIISITVFCLLAMAISNALRYHNGSAMFLGIVIILSVHLKNKCITMRDYIILFLLLVSSYNLFTTTIPRIMHRYYDVNEVDYNAYPWHAFLIGLGYIDNPYGLKYVDTIARNIVAERYPNVDYLSEEYFMKCKDIYIEICKSNPKFVIKCYCTKIVDSVKLQFNCLLSKRRLVFFVATIAIFVSLVFIYKNSSFGREAILILVLGYFMCFIYLGQGIVAVPALYYSYGGIGGIGVVVFFLFMCGISKVIDCTSRQKIEKTI